MTEDEVVGWHHRLNGHESEQTWGDGEGQGSLACCSPWGYKESDITEQLNNMCFISHWVSPQMPQMLGYPFILQHEAQKNLLGNCMY